MLHTFFEDAAMRGKITEFAQALYNTERIFYEYCRKYEVDYFVYSSKYFLDYSIVGTRFLADRLSVNPDCFAYKAHFHPDQLRGFDLLYQNDCFRVYRVLRGGEEKADEPVDYQPVFDAQYAASGEQ